MVVNIISKNTYISFILIGNTFKLSELLINYTGGNIIQQSTTKHKKIKLKQVQSDQLEKLKAKSTEPFKIKGELRENIVDEIRKNELSMSAICVKLDVNKHSVLKIRKQVIGR